MDRRNQEQALKSPLNWDKDQKLVIEYDKELLALVEAGHKVDDTFVIGQQTPPNLCSWAFQSLFPFAEVLQFGGSFPWESDRNKTTVACPDPENPVVFELRRS